MAQKVDPIPFCQLDVRPAPGAAWAIRPQRGATRRGNSRPRSIFLAPAVFVVSSEVTDPGPAVGCRGTLVGPAPSRPGGFRLFRLARPVSGSRESARNVLYSTSTLWAIIPPNATCYGVLYLLAFFFLHSPSHFPFLFRGLDKHGKELDASHSSRPAPWLSTNYLSINWRLWRVRN